MIRCLVSDLDGTLFYEHKETLFELCDRNHFMMQEIAKDENVRFCVASGRNVYYGQHIMNKYGIKDQAICGYNGVVCLDAGTFTYKDVLPIELLDEIFEISKDLKGIRDYQLLAFNGDRVFHDLNASSLPIFQSEIDILKIGKIHDCVIEDYLKKEEANSNICKVCINFENKEYGDAGMKRILEGLEGQCFITRSSFRAVEMSDLRRNKGSFIEYLKDRYGYKEDEIAVIGDAMNDVSMFKHVTHSFAMEHSTQEVKDLAKHVVKDVAECYEYIKEWNRSQG